MQGNAENSMKLFVPILLFYFWFFIFNWLYTEIIKYFGWHYSTGVNLIWLTYAATGLAVRGTIKKYRRLFTLSEKIKFTAWTLGGVLFLTYLMFTALKPEYGGNTLFFALLLIGFFVFCGIWLVISTSTARLFKKELAVTQNVTKPSN